MENLNTSTSNFSEVKYVKISNGETIAYRESNTGKNVPKHTLCLIHGFISSSLCWDPIASHLGKLFRVIAFDFRGSGYSSYNTPNNSLHDLADDFKMALDELKISKVTIVGWSTGGAITLSFTLRYPD